MKRILLGSHSPRRIELLKEMGIKFKVVDIDYEEIVPPTLKAGQITTYLAKQKAKHYKELHNDELLITADTIVWLKNKNTQTGYKLGKPQNTNEAYTMLKMLSDSVHTVYTSIALTYFVDKKIQIETLTDKTAVHFRHLTNQMIDFYVKTFAPLDKAGAYGIQEWIGYAGIRKINGSFFNVMGLPTDMLYNKLKTLYVI